MKLIAPSVSCPYCGVPFSYYDCRHDIDGYAYCPKCKQPCVWESQVFPVKSCSWGKPASKQGRKKREVK